MIEEAEFLTEKDKRRFADDVISDLARKHHISFDASVEIMNQMIDDDFRSRLLPASGSTEKERIAFVRKFGNHRPSVPEYLLWSAQYHSGYSTILLSYDRKYADRPARRGKAGLYYAVVFTDNRRNRFVIAVEDRIPTPFVSVRKKEVTEYGGDKWVYSFYDQALTKRQAEMIFRNVRNGENREAGKIIKKYFDQSDTYVSSEESHDGVTDVLSMIPPKWRGAWNDALEDVILNGKKAGYYETVIENR